MTSDLIQNMNFSDMSCLTIFGFGIFYETVKTAEIKHKKIYMLMLMWGKGTRELQLLIDVSKID